jgi:hypothetical protein
VLRNGCADKLMSDRIFSHLKFLACPAVGNSEASRSSEKYCSDVYQVLGKLGLADGLLVVEDGILP